MGAGTVSQSVRHIVIAALSQEAQKLAARSGQPAAAIQAWDVPQDLVARALDLGAVVDGDGSVVLTHRVRPSTQHQSDGLYVHGARWREEYLSDGPAAFPRRPANAAEALDMIEAEREKVAVAFDVKARQALAEALERKLGDDYWLKRNVEEARKGRLTPEETAKLDARVAAEEAHEEATAKFAKSERERVEADRAETVRVRLKDYIAGTEVKLPVDYSARSCCPDIFDRAEALQVEREAAKAKVDQATLIARLDRLAALVREVSSDPLVLGRLNATEGGEVLLGLLPEDEARELVRAAKLPIPAEVVDYATRKLDDDDARAECKREDDCPVKFPSNPPDDLTATEWAEVVTIRAALNGAGLPEGELRLHTATCACRNAAADASRRVGVLVRLDLGDGLTLKREYATS